MNFSADRELRLLMTKLTEMTEMTKMAKLTKRLKIHQKISKVNVNQEQLIDF